MGRAPPKKKSSNSVVSAWPGLRPRRWSYSNRCLRPRREKSRNSFYESARKRWHRRRQPRYERAISESFAALGDTPMPLYLEDLTPGLVVAAGPVTVTEADAIRFAKEFDPQYFHTDPVAAKNSMFEGLVVSGWHTAALSMRMLTQSSMAAIANGLVGIEVRTMHWPRATRPGPATGVSRAFPERQRSSTASALIVERSASPHQVDEQPDGEYTHDYP